MLRRGAGSGVFALLLLTVPAPGDAERIFYLARTWLETSSEVRRLSVLGVLRGWEELARSAVRAPLSPRMEQFATLHECLSQPEWPVEYLLTHLERFARRHPQRVFYSLSDFVAEALRELCLDGSGGPPAAVPRGPAGASP